MPAAVLPDLNALDRAALRELVLKQHAEITSHEAEIERLRLVIAQLRRMQFGRKSEKIEREIAQLELQLEELESKSAGEKQAAEREASATTIAEQQKPVRRLLPEHLPRKTQMHEPQYTACPDCGGRLSRLGEDVSEMLEYIPASFHVIRHVRPKLSCTKCDVIVQAEAPSRPIARGLAGAGLLAHVLVSKYADHCPLHRQAEIYAREGVDLDRSTLADWVGASSALWNRSIRRFASM